MKALRLESLCLFPREPQEKPGPWGSEVTQAPRDPLESRDSLEQLEKKGQRSVRGPAGGNLGV